MRLFKAHVVMDSDSSAQSISSEDPLGVHEQAVCVEPCDTLGLFHSCSNSLGTLLCVLGESHEHGDPFEYARWIQALRLPSSKKPVPRTVILPSPVTRI